MPRILTTVNTSNTKFSTSSYGGVDADWLENDDSHIFKFNIPGMKIDDVHVQVVGRNILQVSGECNNQAEMNLYNGKWHIKERSTSSFLRKFQLPEDVKLDEITAFDEYGVLVVIAPKKKHYLRNIPISIL
eukprot:c16565_g1_i1 orf=312-704(-)